MTPHHEHSSVRTVSMITLISFLLIVGNVVRTGFAQKTAVCTYKHLLLLCPNADFNYVENGTARTYRGNMTTELKTTIMNAFKNLPNLIANGSNGLVDSTYQIQEIAHSVTKVTALGSDYYWLSPSDIQPDLELYAPKGAYDSVHVVWHSGAYSGVKAYFGMGGVFINNGATTFDSLIGGESWWWTSLGEAFGEPLLHEWLHGVCRFYAGLGYSMPDYDADGADEHGYSKSASDGWMSYYRDLMRGQVWEPRLSKYTGITAAAWASATPIPEVQSLTLMVVLSGAAIFGVLSLKKRPCRLAAEQRP